MPSTRPAATHGSAAKQLDGFLAAYTPEIDRLARAALARLRKRVPNAVEMVYDNYNALVIGFSPTDRASDAVLSLVLYPRWIMLCFLRGASLPDPAKRLRGDGKIVRNLVLDDLARLDDPAVCTLIERACAQATAPFPARRRMVIKSISRKQRRRRPRGSGASAGVTKL